MAGKTAVVTGGNSGIGVETVRALASAGCRVILASRSVPAGEAVAQELRGGTGVKVGGQLVSCSGALGCMRKESDEEPRVLVSQGAIVVKQLDLSDLESVRAFSADFLKTEKKGPDLLILNAGVMGCPLTYTKDGFEMQIGGLPQTALYLLCHS